MQMKAGVRLTRANPDALALGTERFDRLSLRIGVWTSAKIDCLTAEVAAELRHVRVVAIEKGDSVRGQRFDQFIFGAGNAGDAVGKKLRVSIADISDDSPVGCGDAGERGNFAGAGHAHFDNGNLMFGLKLEQLQGE